MSLTDIIVNSFRDYIAQRIQRSYSPLENYYVDYHPLTRNSVQLLLFTVRYPDKFTQKVLKDPETFRNELAEGLHSRIP